MKQKCLLSSGHKLSSLKLKMILASLDLVHHHARHYHHGGWYVHVYFLC